MYHRKLNGSVFRLFFVLNNSHNLVNIANIYKSRFTNHLRSLQVLCPERNTPTTNPHAVRHQK